MTPTEATRVVLFGLLVPLAVAGCHGAASTAPGPAPAPAVAAEPAASRAPAACARDCQGKPSTALVEALTERQREAAGCYGALLGQLDDPTTGPQGVVVVGLAIGADGTVCDVELAEDTVGHGLGACVLHAFQTPSLPAPLDGCVFLRLPVRFMLSVEPTEPAAPGDAPAAPSAPANPTAQDSGKAVQ